MKRIYIDGLRQTRCLNSLHMVKERVQKQLGNPVFSRKYMRKTLKRSWLIFCVHMMLNRKGPWKLVSDEPAVPEETVILETIEEKRIRLK